MAKAPLSDRMVDTLPTEFHSDIRLDGQISISGKLIPEQTIVEKLSSMLTTERKMRIEEVIRYRTLDITTVAEHLYDIGNISAVMRSAESFGFLPFHIIERPGSRYKKSDRISKGTEKWLKISRSNDSIEAIQSLKKDGYAVYATSLNATHKIAEIDFCKPTAVIFGNEKDGVSESALQASDGAFVVPMYGFAQSFNISVAAALTFQHIFEFRRKNWNQLKDSKSPFLDEKTANIVRAHYMLRSVDHPERFF